MNLRTGLAVIDDDLTAAGPRRGLSTRIQGIDVPLDTAVKVQAWLDGDDPDLLAEVSRARLQIVRDAGGEIA